MGSDIKLICHVHSDEDGNPDCIFYHTLDEMFEGKGPLYGNGSKDTVKELLALKEWGYRFFVGDGEDHEPPLYCPNSYCKAKITELGLPIKLPD
ncbi:MAG: hypothetical protein GTN76_01500 [Candidatus Aenigmarchaeota archaeon]|nr:hypothetical protein [Candidatus Aenigmarchaeota archaeon]